MHAWRPCTSNMPRRSFLAEEKLLRLRTLLQVFARMDDWIKDRVKEENEAIKARPVHTECRMIFALFLSLHCFLAHAAHLEATEALLRSGRWDDEVAATYDQFAGTLYQGATITSGNMSASQRRPGFSGARLQWQNHDHCRYSPSAVLTSPQQRPAAISWQQQCRDAPRQSVLVSGLHRMWQEPAFTTTRSMRRSQTSTMKAA